MSSRSANIIHWIVIIAMPFLLGFGVITLIISPWYPRYEYAKENFPPDRYGFTQEQRLELALVAVDYLERRAPAEDVIYLLEEQTLPGTTDPLYNDREIDHMLDVKRLSDILRRTAWFLGVVVVSGLVILLYRSETERYAYRSLYLGGVGTILMLVAIGLFLVVAWDVFFVQFHELLFPPGTWTFSYSDSLIRLFPEKFWFDVGVLIVGTTLVMGVLTTLTGYRWMHRTPVASKVRRGRSGRRGRKR